MGLKQKKMNEQRKEAIKAFCRFIDNYKGEMTIRNSQIFNSNKELIYQLKL